MCTEVRGHSEVSKLMTDRGSVDAGKLGISQKEQSWWEVAGGT